MIAAGLVLFAFVLLFVLCAIPSIRHRLDTPKRNHMSTTEGPLPQHELDQVLAAMKADGITVAHVIGSMAILDTVLEELPTAPAGMESHALVSLTGVRDGLQAHKARFLQIFNALTGANAHE